MSKQTYELRTTGSVVYIGYVDCCHDDVFKRVIGPVTISKSNMTVEQNAKGEPIVSKKYYFSSLGEYYFDYVCFDNWTEADLFAEKELHRLQELAKKSQSQ